VFPESRELKGLVDLVDVLVHKELKELPEEEPVLE
jgi:hypothetical protein